MAGRDDRNEARSPIRPRHVALAVMVGLLLWFGFANSDRVEVDFLVTERDVRLIYALALAALLGAAIGVLAVRSRDR